MFCRSPQRHTWRFFRCCVIGDAPGDEPDDWRPYRTLRMGKVGFCTRMGIAHVGKRWSRMGSLEIRPYLRSLSLEFQELSTRRRSESPHRSCLGNCQQLDQFISKDVNLPELSRTVCFWRRLGVVTPSNDAFRFKAIMRSPERDNWERESIAGHKEVRTWMSN